MSDIKRSAIVIAITGGIACGKSEVGRILEEMGFKVCDADRVAHELMAKGTPVYSSVVGFFGKYILTQDGEISRPLLGNIVFEDNEKRLQLNRLVHPAVRDVLAERIASCRDKGENAAVQIPLLFESGMESLDWDVIICVTSPEELVFERLEKRGMDRQEALKRLQSQMSLADKERRSDRVIHNFGTMQELEMATRAVVKSLVGDER